MKSLEELIDSKKKLQEINNHINYIWFKLIAPLVIVSLILIYAISNQLEYLDDLKTKDTFTCRSFIEGQFSIIVNKKDGWRVEDDYFIKGDNKILIKKCKALKEDSDE